MHLMLSSVQIILHVHRLWNAGRPMDAVKTCIELTGMWDDIEEVSHSAPKCYNPNTLVTRDHALFLNILLQMPISWYALCGSVFVRPCLYGLGSPRQPFHWDNFTERLLEIRRTNAFGEARLHNPQYGGLDDCLGWQVKCSAAWQSFLTYRGETTRPRVVSPSRVEFKISV